MFVKENPDRKKNKKNVSKYGVFSGLYFPVFGLNTGKYEPEKTLYLDIFLAVFCIN